MPTDDSLRPTPVIAATVVNGLLVLSLPFIASVILALSPSNMQSGAFAYDPAISPLARAARNIIGIIDYVALMAPLAAVTAWRTWVHATQWHAGERSWRGILEAGLVGFATVAVPILFAVAPHLFTQPLVAVGYVFFYGLIGLAVGLGLGLVLQLTALVVLMISETVTN